MRIIWDKHKRGGLWNSEVEHNSSNEGVNITKVTRLQDTQRCTTDYLQRPPEDKHLSV